MITRQKRAEKQRPRNIYEKKRKENNELFHTWDSYIVTLHIDLVAESTHEEEVPGQLMSHQWQDSTQAVTEIINSRLRWVHILHVLTS